MKKVMISIFLFALLGILGGCAEKENSNDSEGRTIEQLSEWTGKLGMTQITEDESLCGTRTLENEEDYYTGNYIAETDHVTGRDVVFGGAGIEERTIVCSGTVNIKTGSIKIRVRMNEEVVYVSPDESGHFEKEFSFASGGNYIMVDYEDFTGNIDLRCTEGEDEHEE